MIFGIQPENVGQIALDNSDCAWTVAQRLPNAGYSKADVYLVSWKASGGHFDYAVVDSSGNGFDHEGDAVQLVSWSRGQAENYPNKNEGADQ
ncbi:MAG: hypothetical protein AAGH90_10535 [Pseudomonadota bacterium]